MKRNVKLNGKELTFDLPTEADQSVFDEIYRDKEYRGVEGILQNAKVILDLGAHIGLFSVYASVLAAEGAKIYAFEPDERNFLIMKEHLKMNGVRNVQVKNVAVGAESGERELYLSEDSHNHSFIGVGEGKKVRAASLPDILRKNRLEKVDLVKMDIEGAEFEVMEALTGEDFSKIKSFYIEYHELTGEMRSSDLMKQLAVQGYTVERVFSNYDRKMGYLIARR
jgi:FkbM family methyltransferase